MSSFKNIENDANIQKTIQNTFDVKLSIDGNWGYTQEDASIIKSIQNEMPLKQLEHMLTTMRAHLEMNLTQTEANRYSAINANEKTRETLHDNTLVYDKVTYEITAIKEALFKAFILEYKEGYEKEGFDLSEHFRRRKAATITREIVHYFEISTIKQI